MEQEEECSVWFPNAKKWVEVNKVQSRFLTYFEMIENQLIHSVECLIYLLLKLLVILREIQGKILPNFVIIKVLFANLLLGSDLLCFLFVFQPHLSTLHPDILELTPIDLCCVGPC